MREDSRMALPSQLVYNDLDGEEVKHILEERFHILLEQVSYLRRHITLPRVKMTLAVHLDVWADQANPERQNIQDALEIRSESGCSGFNFTPLDLSATINAAPGGQPPDKIREDYNLGIPTPVRGAVAVEDRVEGRRMTMDSGAVVDRTGKAPERSGATVVVQDFGVAGLARGQINRPQANYGNTGNRDGGAVRPPVLPK